MVPGAQLGSLLGGDCTPLSFLLLSPMSTQPLYRGQYYDPGNLFEIHPQLLGPMVPKCCQVGNILCRR